MATLDLGKIKQVWRGTYNNSTAYVVDDLVEYTDNNITSTYICVANSTGNAPSTGGTAHASWNFVAKGVVDPIPSQSGNAGKFLKTDGTNLSYDNAGGWVKIAGGTGPSSPVTAIEINNIFSAAYHVYKVYLFWSQDDWMKCRVMTSSGDVNNNYMWTGLYSKERTDGDGRYGGHGSDHGIATYYNSEDNAGMTCELTFIDPFNSSKETTWNSMAGYREGSTMWLEMCSNINSNVQSHTGIRIFGNNGDAITDSNFNYVVLGAKI